MNNIIVRNSLRFLFLLALQVLVLKQINPGGASFNYISIFIYPLFLMLLPLRLPHALLILIGFVLGISVDFFYDSIGVHAATCVSTAFLRPLILRILEPASGYNENDSPTKRKYGAAWFLGYASLFVFIHLFIYFSVEAFSFVYIKEILLRTFSSFALSILLIILYQFLFDPAV